MREPRDSVIQDRRGPFVDAAEPHEVFASADDEEFRLVARSRFPPGSPFGRSETLRIFTPFAQFNDDAPAFLLWSGGEDDQVPPATFEWFLEALAPSRGSHRVPPIPSLDREPR
jgi:hypothetical protein